MYLEKVKKRRKIYFIILLYEENREISNLKVIDLLKRRVNVKTFQF